TDFETNRLFWEDAFDYGQHGGSKRMLAKRDACAEGTGGVGSRHLELSTVHPQLEDPIGKPAPTARRPKISIMLITYNHEKYIAQALESVLMQETEYDYEINVIEDCSTDKTQEIVTQYVRKYPNIVK